MERRGFLAVGAVVLSTNLAGCSTEGAENPEAENGSEDEIRDSRYVDPIQTPTPTRSKT